MKLKPIILPVCPECGAVGSQPGQKGRGARHQITFHCLGEGNQHRKTKMELVRFVPEEVVR